MNWARTARAARASAERHCGIRLLEWRWRWSAVVPDAVCHIIAAHAAEGDLVKRTTEAYIVHHADFMAFCRSRILRTLR